jgi:hypothetical protein
MFIFGLVTREESGAHLIRVFVLRKKVRIHKESGMSLIEHFHTQIRIDQFGLLGSFKIPGLFLLFVLT